MTQIRPAAALSCWGLKFQDGEPECRQCRDNDSCRSAVLDRSLVASRSLPVLSNRPNIYPPPPPMPTMPGVPSTGMSASPRHVIAQMPAQRPYYPPAPSQPLVQQPQPPKPATPQQVTHQANQYYQQSTGYSLQNPDNPNPLTPMHRPGAPSPVYYFTQYPGESVGIRIVKNAILRALEAIMFELMQFFRHWTWPSVAR